MRSEHNYDIADRTGIASAVLCTIHCLVIPALFLFKGFYGGQVAASQLPYWWEYVDFAFLIISFLAVYHAAGHTGTKQIKIALWISWVVLAVAIVFESLHWLAYFASAGLITTHLINIKRMTRAYKSIDGTR